MGEVGKLSELGGRHSPSHMRDFSPPVDRPSPSWGRPASSQPPVRTHMRDFSPPVLRASHSLAPASPPQPPLSGLSPPALRPPARQRSDPQPSRLQDSTLQHSSVANSLSLSQPGSERSESGASGASGGLRVSLVYDQVLNCYFDPVSHRYFELC